MEESGETNSSMERAVSQTLSCVLFVEAPAVAAACFDSSPAAQMSDAAQLVRLLISSSQEVTSPLPPEILLSVWRYRRDLDLSLSIRAVTRPLS